MAATTSTEAIARLIGPRLEVELRADTNLSRTDDAGGQLPGGSEGRIDRGDRVVVERVEQVEHHLEAVALHLNVLRQPDIEQVTHRNPLRARLDERHGLGL